MNLYKLIAVMVLFSISALRQTVPSTRQVATEAFRSVVLIVMEDEKGQPLSLGSGFIVADGVVASNQHVVEGASGGYAKLIGQKKKYNIAGVVGLNQRNDLVLLSVEGIVAPAMELANDGGNAVGDSIFAVGNPQGLEGTFSQGIISGIRQFDADSLLQITAPISPGSSGGPVLDANGKVVGVAVATYKGGQNLNFAIPAKYLRDLMKNVKPVIAFAPKAKKEGKSLLDELGGGKSTDGVSVKAFKWGGSSGNVSAGCFSVSVVNHLREPVKNITCLVIFYDAEDSPLDFVVLKSADITPAGLGKRVTGMISSSAAALNDSPDRGIKGRIEFRVLGFEMVPE